MNKNAETFFFLTVMHCPFYIWHYLALGIPVPLCDWNKWLSIKISSVSVVISFLVFCSTFNSYLIILFQCSLFRNIISVSFHGKAGMAFYGGLLSCTSTPYQRYSSAGYVKHFEIWMEFINCVKSSLLKCEDYAWQMVQAGSPMSSYALGILKQLQVTQLNFRCKWTYLMLKSGSFWSSGIFFSLPQVSQNRNMQSKSKSENWLKHTLNTAVA